MKSRKSTPPRKASAGVEVAASGLFPAVAIGASAGGLEAYRDFFSAMPNDLGMAFILVQHLDPTHHSLLADIIAKATTMPVNEVKAGMKMRPDCVYVIPPDTLMGIADGVFHLTPRSKQPGQHLSVNFFMRALAEERGSLAIAVVLSGTGADGTVGVSDIKAEGGLTFAQDPESAKYDGMPRSAIASGSVDFVLTPRDIAKELTRFHHHPYFRQPEQVPEVEPEAEVSVPRKDDFSGVITQLRRSSGVDFSQYKPNTIHRRALRRMLMLKVDSATEYAAHLKEHPEEAEKLYDDVLIPVTSFFRDFEAFEALKAHVYPAIVKDKGNKGTIRMWAPGCSTGEETYSLAMTLLEFLGDKASSYQVQIFGTDLNEKGINKARAGVYKEGIAEEISADRLQRFFLKVEEGYRVNKAVRDMCVFAKQNLANDPPFSQMNLVACRNLLIYLSSALQRKIVPILHYALKPSGFLVLGKSEGVSGFQNLFSALDAKHKIYSKNPVASRLHYDFSQTHYPAGSGASAQRKAEIRGAPELEFDAQGAADRLVLKHHSPVGVVVNDAMEVVQFRGRTTPYLEPAPGKPSLNVLKLARNGLAMELRGLINAARKKGAPVKKDGISFEGDGHARILDLSVLPLAEKGAPGKDRYFLVLFEEASRVAAGPAESGRKSKTGAKVTQDVKRLNQQLAESQDALRAAIESEEAVKEEFQSANEEILSANEELQSTNEELETSKEELQSANEELNTLNDELRHKNRELHDANSDISNFLNSTRIPVVMLDRTLRIRRLTPNADALLKATPSDVGRPISDIRLNIKVADLELMAKKVLDSLQPSHLDVQDEHDQWHSLSISPYKSLDNRIDGVVLSLQDIHALKIANEQLRISSEFFRGIIDTVREPLLVLDADLRVIAANQPFLSEFRVTAEQTVRKFLYRLGNEQWNIPALRALLEKVLPEQQVVSDFEVEHTFEHIGRRTMLLNARRLYQANAREAMILLAIEDITERKLGKTALIRSEKLAAAGRLAASLAHEINNPLQAVTNLMTLLEGSQKLDPQDRQNAVLASRELGRVVHLVRQSLGFYRESTSPTPMDLGEVIDSVLVLYNKQIEAKSITLDKQYRVKGPIESYPGEIRQVVSTLLINALEACGEGCRILLRSSRSADWRDLAVSGIRLTLADDGGGISAANAARVFEPFFTTKDERGTGLGLWVAFAIVQRLGGSIRVHSSTRPRKSGTAFSIFLPDPTPKREKV